MGFNGVLDGGNCPVLPSTYGEMVIFVPVSCSIFLRLRPSLPISLPTRLLCAKIFKGISSALKYGKKPNPQGPVGPETILQQRAAATQGRNRKNIIPSHGISSASGEQELRDCSNLIALLCFTWFRIIELFQLKGFCSPSSPTHPL